MCLAVERRGKTAHGGSVRNWSNGQEAATIAWNLDRSGGVRTPRSPKSSVGASIVVVGALARAAHIESLNDGLTVGLFVERRSFDPTPSCPAAPPTLRPQRPIPTAPWRSIRWLSTGPNLEAQPLRRVGGENCASPAELVALRTSVDPFIVPSRHRAWWTSWTVYEPILHLASHLTKPPAGNDDPCSQTPRCPAVRPDEGSGSEDLRQPRRLRE